MLPRKSCGKLLFPLGKCLEACRGPRLVVGFVANIGSGRSPSGHYLLNALLDIGFSYKAVGIVLSNTGGGFGAKVPVR